MKNLSIGLFYLVSVSISFISATTYADEPIKETVSCLSHRSILPVETFLNWRVDYLAYLSTRCLHGILDSGNFVITSISDSMPPYQSKYPPLLLNGELTGYCKDLGYRIGYISFDKNTVVEVRGNENSLQSTIKSHRNWYQAFGSDSRRGGQIFPITEMKCI